MSHLDEWQVFTNRYGVECRGDDTWADKQPWCSRHKTADSEAVHRCACPGGSMAATICALPVTQEDGLCDECRQWCVAIDDAGYYHQFASLKGHTR